MPPIAHNREVRDFDPQFRGGELVTFWENHGAPERAGPPIERWDIASGQRLAEVAIEGRVVDLSPDGSAVLTFDSVCDARTGEVLKTGKGWSFEHGGFHPDGEGFVGCFSDAREWRLTRAEPREQPARSPRDVTAVAWNADATLFARATKSGLVRVFRGWARPDAEPAPAGRGLSFAVVVNEDGSLFAAPGLSQIGWGQAAPDRLVLRCYRTEDSAPAGPGLLPGGHICCAAFDGDRIVLGTGALNAVRADSADVGELHVFDWAEGGAARVSVRLPSEPADILPRKGEGGLLVLCRGGEIVAVPRAGGAPERVAQAAAIPPESERRNGKLHLANIGGREYLIASSWRATECFALPSGEPLWRVVAHDFGGLITASSVSEARGEIALAASSGQPVNVGLMVVDIASGARRTIEFGTRLGANDARFDAAGERLLLACGDRVCRIIDPASGRVLAKSAEHSREGASADFFGASPWMASAGGHNDFRVWDPRTGLPVAPPPPTGLDSGNIALEPVAGGILLAGTSRLGRILYRLPDAGAEGAGELALTELRADATIDAGQNLTKLTEDEWLERWRRYRAEHPDHGADALRPERGDLLTWHRFRALQIESDGVQGGFAHLWHLRRWIEIDPADPRPRVLLAVYGGGPVRKEDPEGFARFREAIFGHPAYRLDPVSLAAYGRAHQGPHWGRVAGALEHLSRGKVPPTSPEALAESVGFLRDLPEDVRAWIGEMLSQTGSRTGVSGGVR